MRKLRIAQITNLWESIPPQGKGGLEQLVYDLTEELVKKGHEVTVFGTADSQTNAKLEAVWPVALSRDPHIPFRDKQTFALWAVSEAFLHNEEFDVIHDHTYFVAGHFAGVIKTPIVSTIHHPIGVELDFIKSLPNNYHPYLAKQLNHYNNMTSVVVSNFQQKQLRELNREGILIHNGIPLDSWKKYSDEPGSYFAFLGYMSGNKGAAEAIQAILGTPHKLLLAGTIDEHDSASWEYFKQKVEPFIDGEQIQFLGKVDHDGKQDLLANAKATLMPIQWDEPFGLVAIESLAVGTPVIGMARGALPEIVQNNKTGFIVSNVQEMKEALEKVEQLSRQACRRSVIDNFTVEKMADQYEALYSKVIK